MCCTLNSIILPRVPLLADTQKMGQAFSKLMAQYNENEMVLKELKMLGDDSKVFKLVGPVLLSQVCVEPVMCWPCSRMFAARAADGIVCTCSV